MQSVGRANPDCPYSRSIRIVPQPLDRHALPFPMRSRLPLVPVLVALLCGCGPRWGEIESKEGGFRVYMPTPTKRIDAALTDENGTFHYLGYGREARSAFAIPSGAPCSGCTWMSVR